MLKTPLIDFAQGGNKTQQGNAIREAGTPVVLQHKIGHWGPNAGKRGMPQVTIA